MPDLGCIHPRLAGWRVTRVNQHGDWGPVYFTPCELKTVLHTNDRALILKVQREDGKPFVMKLTKQMMVCRQLLREYRHMVRLVKNDTDRCVVPPHELIEIWGMVALIVPMATSDFYQVLNEVNTGCLAIADDALSVAWRRLIQDATKLLRECAIVHCDIKPENTVVTSMEIVEEEGCFPVLKGLRLALIDLGSSREVGEDVQVDYLGFTAGYVPDEVQRMFDSRIRPAPVIKVTSKLDEYALEATAKIVAQITDHAAKIAAARAKTAKRRARRAVRAHIEAVCPGAPRKAPVPMKRQTSLMSDSQASDPLRTPEKRRRSNM
jgi:serine/threonine protein kinase